MKRKPARVAKKYWERMTYSRQEIVKNEAAELAPFVVAACRPLSVTFGLEYLLSPGVENVVWGHAW